MAYQGTFAIITAALISGAIVERMRFSAYLAFITLWALFVYAPGRALGLGRRLAGQDGRPRLRGRHRRARQRRRGRAGGGAGARAAQGLRPPGLPSPQRGLHRAGRGPALVRLVRLQRGQRAGRQRLRQPRLHEHDAGPRGDARRVDAARPHAHGQGHRGRRAPPASWSAWWPSRPRPGSWARWRRIALGGLAAFPSYYALLWRARTRLDDSLDVVAAHGVGGTVGALLTGVLASKAWNGAADGLLFGNPRQLGIQAVAVLAAIAYSARRHVRAAEAGRPRRSPLRADAKRRRPGPRRQPARRGGLRAAARARSWCCPRPTPRPSVPVGAGSRPQGGRA